FSLWQWNGTSTRSQSLSAGLLLDVEDTEQTGWRIFQKVVTSGIA
ncbi:hypothetical protein EVA_17241, partial [gut metagenome]